MNGNIVTIIRDGKLINIQEDKLCLGDIVVLQVGEIVPADIQLVEANGLEIDEFEITGEILPVHKKVKDNHDFLFMGTKVTRGTGKGLVVATGDKTEYGGILKQEWEKNRPFEFKLFRTRYLWLLGLLLPALLIDLSRSNNHIIVIAFYLFCSVVLVLLQNTQLLYQWIISHYLKEYQKSGINVRDPRVFDQFNEIDIYCFDKTGVLTSRQIEVKNIFLPYGKLYIENKHNKEYPFSLVKIACALCNDINFFEKIETANPIDKALIAFAMKNGIDISVLLSQYKRIYDQPFDSENRYMVCGYKSKNKEVYFFTKGDPEVILRMCDHYVSAAGIQIEMNFNVKRTVLSQMNTISQNGNTAIALAYAVGAINQKPSKFTFLCLAQLETPLHPDAQDIIRKITKEGKRGVILTGDRADNALRVGKECGIAIDSEACLTGKMIEKMDLQEVTRQSSYCSVFARLIPSQKGVLIRLFQRKGHRVAMIGDGPNDGIALKVADVGISFVENSSPIARRLSKILINDLSDLLNLFNDAKKIRIRLHFWNLFRTLLIALVLIYVYLSKLFF